MKNILKINFLASVSLIFLAIAFAGCDDYERKGKVIPEITVNMRSLNLKVGETKQLVASPTVNTFTWSSEDDDIATVDGAGLVTAKSEGETGIIVKSGDAIRRVTTIVTIID